MSAWLELAGDNRIAAQELASMGRFRSSVSRSYYAAYAGVTHLLVGKVNYPSGRNNPSHQSILGHIVHNLPDVAESKRRTVRRDFSALLKARIDADYRPGLSCDSDIARQARIRSDSILEEIGFL